MSKYPENILGQHRQEEKSMVIPMTNCKRFKNPENTCQNIQGQQHTRAEDRGDPVDHLRGGKIANWACRATDARIANHRVAGGTQ